MRNLALLVFGLMPVLLYSQDCQCDTLKSPKGFLYQGTPVKIADNKEAMITTTSLSGVQFGPDTVLRVLIFAIATTRSRGTDVASITIAAQDGSELQLSNTLQKWSQQSSTESGRNAEYVATYILTPEQLSIASKPLKEIAVYFEGGDKITTPTKSICTTCLQMPFPPIKKMIAEAIRKHNYECDVARNGKAVGYRCRDSQFFELHKDDDLRIYTDVSATKPQKGKTTYTLGFLVKQSEITDVSRVQIVTRNGATLHFENGVQGERKLANYGFYEFLVSYTITKKQLDAISEPLQSLIFTFDNGNVTEVSAIHICTECAQKATRK